jgi:hypothetical protein
MLSTLKSRARAKTR